MNNSEMWLSIIVAVSVAAGLLILWIAAKAASWVHERYFLDPEERWRRRYDRNLKKYFKEF